MFRPSVLSWMAPALALLVLGLGLGNVLLLTGSAFILMSTLLVTVLSAPSVVVDRRLPRLTVWAGDAQTVERRVSLSGGMGTVFLHDEIPGEARIVVGSNLRVVWKWPGEKIVDLSYRLEFPKRGRFILETTRWESMSPFGFSESSGSGGEYLEISVVPRIRSVNRLNEVRAVSASARFQDDIAKTGASTDEFRELRPYQPGDPMKLINWKASARMFSADNPLLVNEFEPETKKAVWIFLDVADYMDVGASQSNPMEKTLEASGALAQYYLWKGSTLGAYAYNTSGRYGEMLSPESGRKQLNRLMTMLTSLKSGRQRQDLLRAVEYCKDFLFQLRPEVFIITRLDVHYARPGQVSESLNRFQAALTRLNSLRARSRRPGGVRLIHVSPQGSSLDSQVQSLTRWESRAVANTLRKSGASVMEWEPDAEDFTSVLARHVGTSV